MTISPYPITSDFVEQLMSTTHAIVLFTDRAGRVVLFNQYMRALSGYELDDLLGKDWCEQLIADDQRERIRGLSFTGAGDSAREVHAELVTKSGARRQIEWTGSTVHADDGEVLGLLCVGHDLTELCELRAALAERERLANIGMMASTFAHDVGNPLNSLSLQLQLLLRRVDRPDRGTLAPKVEVLLTEVRRLTNLLDDFRAYQDPTKLQLEPTDLGGVVRDVSSLLTARASAHAVEVECDVAEQLPCVLGSASKLKQVLINLCKNGIDSMPAGGKLRVSVHPEPNAVLIDVTDQGGGIPDGLDVFALFSTTKRAGVGLGLPLAREIIAAHAGDLRYVTAPGRGTTFTVSLPCSRS